MQGGNRDDLIGFFRHSDLPHDETLARGEGRHHVDRLFRALLLIGEARGLPSMAMISAGVVVSAATQATKQRWKACASSVAKISPDDYRGRAVAIGAEPAQEVELLFAKEGMSVSASAAASTASRQSQIDGKLQAAGQ